MSWDLLASAGAVGATGPQGSEFSGLPVGCMVDWPGLTEPEGWEFCYGQERPRVGIYAELFAALGGVLSPWGLGNGTTTFNLPDFRGRVPAGRDDMGGIAANRLTTAWGVDGATLGANGGDQSHLLTGGQMPNHSHTYRYAVGPGSVVASGNGITLVDGTLTGPAGGGLAHPNVQPTGVVNRIIKYAHSNYTLLPGTGDVTGPGTSVDGEIAIYAGTTGKQLGSVSRIDAAPVGSTVQTKVVFSKAPLSTTAIWPTDNTPPQITEGGLALTLIITPKYQNSMFLVVASGVIVHSLATAASTSPALFRAGVNNTIGSLMTVSATNAYQIPFCIQAPDFPDTLSDITYSLRIGGFGAASTTYLGRRGDANVYLGSTQITTLTVQEIKQ